MKDIAIYGAGGLGREVASALSNIICDSPDGWNLVGFFDDGYEIGTEIFNSAKILGGMKELNEWDRPLCVALCFGSPATMKAVSSRLSNPNLSFPNLICKSVYIGDRNTFRIGKGNIIQGTSEMTVNVSLGDFNLLNGDVVLGHDVNIGNCNILMPGCRISGEVTMGDCCLIGAMAFVKQQLRLGDHVTLSPLSALLTKPKDNALYIGNPAKRLKY